MDQYAQVIIGIESLFIILVIMASLRSVSVNQHGYSRTIRLWVFAMTIFYVFDYSLNFSTLLLADLSIKSEFISLGSFTGVSLMVMYLTIVYDYKKISVRKVWEINSGYNKDWNGDDKSNIKFIINSIKTLYCACVAFLSSYFIGSMKINENFLWMFSLSNIMQVLFIIIVILISQFLKTLLKDNIEYNYLKNIILNGNKKLIDNDIRREYVKRMLFLYDKLFVKSIFYRKASATNLLIKKEIMKF